MKYTRRFLKWKLYLIISLASSRLYETFLYSITNMKYLKIWNDKFIYVIVRPQRFILIEILNMHFGLTLSNGAANEKPFLRASYKVTFPGKRYYSVHFTGFLRCYKNGFFNYIRNRTFITASIYSLNFWRKGLQSFIWIQIILHLLSFVLFMRGYEVA
jgi:hypothetical protein